VSRSPSHWEAIRRHRYYETFRRHRLLLSLPIVVSIAIAGWVVLSKPKSYLSTTSLWVDTPASAQSSLGSSNAIPTTSPAQQEQGVLNELLATRTFVLDVGHKSSLGRYLAANPSRGSGPSSLFSGGGGSVDTRILEALGRKQVLTGVAGPQVLQITLLGPTSDVAASTLRAIVAQLQQVSTGFSTEHRRAAVSYYRSQVAAASKALTAARAQINAYLRLHPGASVQDPNLNTLTASATAASTQLTQANSSLNQAESMGGWSVQLIDQPSVATGPVSGRKKEFLAILGGLFAGALISFLGIVALTPSDADDRWEDELLEALTNAPATGRLHEEDMVEAVPTNGTHQGPKQRLIVVRHTFEEKNLP
jgi:uncharacterized protein involved in exopolysaccharide biosynthesis